MSMQRTQSKRRRGFTLVELMVVVLILGIISAVAAPKMFGTTTVTKQNATKSSLSVIRNAIELYKSNDPNSAYPPAPLATSLKPYLNGAFPACPLVSPPSAAVNMQTGTTPVAVAATPDGWVYNATTGEFGANDAVGITY